jgi:hypothetical protein
MAAGGIPARCLVYRLTEVILADSNRHNALNFGLPRPYCIYDGLHSLVM